MDRIILGVLALTVIVSGCSDLPGGTSDVPELPQKGIEIDSFRVSDDTLRPGQETVLTLRLENYHTDGPESLEKSIINTGSLEVESRGCNPSEIGTASSQIGNPSSMTCRWDVTAPSEEEIGGFDSKPASATLLLEYDASIQNRRPMKVEFKPMERINVSRPRTKSFSNQEVSVEMETESPTSLESGMIEVTLDSAGKGQVEQYTGFEFTPSEIFDCTEETPVEPEMGDEYFFSCSLDEDQEITRNLYISTSYKYVQDTTVNMEIVNNQ